MMPASDHTAKPGRLLIGSFFLRNLGLEGVGTFISGLAQGMTDQGWDVSLVLPAGSRRHLTAASRCRSILTYTPGVRAIRTYGRMMASEGSRYDRILLLENNPNSLAVISRLSGVELSDNRVFSYLYTPLLALKTMRELQWQQQAWKHVGAKWSQWARLAEWRHARIVVGSTFQKRQLLQLGARRVAVIRASVIPVDGGASTEKDAVEQIHQESPTDQTSTLESRPFTIGYLGHFSPAKGVGQLLDAFAVARQTQSMRLLIAHSGKGSLSSRHQALLNSMIADRSVQMAAVVDPLQFLSGCDVTVLPYPSCSIHHPPLVLIESMAAGTPVVTTDVGGLPEIVNNGKTGFILPPGNIEQLVEKMIWLAKHPDETGRMGAHTRRQFKKELCRDVCCRQLDTILRGQNLEG